MKKIISSCILLLCTSFLLAQSNSELTREFSFENDSDPIEFVVEVQEGSQELLFALNSFTMGGDLKVILLSPSGKKEGGFRLQSMPGKNKVKEKSKSKEKTGASSITSKSKSSTSTSTSVNTNTNTNTNTNSQESGSRIETSSDGDNTFTYSMSSNKNSISKGNMNKTISNPESGAWKVVIDPADVTGELLIRIRQKSRN
ncbi:MAG: hypothetical protein R8P61_35520 [Bacteroidia bacterium]|nr:hypothetical protein [Bacteroidia bacterium]